VLKAKEIFVMHGPWLVHGSLEKLKEKIEILLGGTDKVDAHHVSSCVSYCKEKYTLWRADIRKKVLNRKLNHLKIAEFTAKLYAPFKTKEEDMKNAGKTAMLLVNCFYCFYSCYSCKIEMMYSWNETFLKRTPLHQL